jgi:hypothetical protein
MMIFSTSEYNNDSPYNSVGSDVHDEDDDDPNDDNQDDNR